MNGNTLIVDNRKRRAIEVTPKGQIVWKHYPGAEHVFDADRLPNGNTLIALRKPHMVCEVTAKGKVVWELKGLGNPMDADRLPSGQTLVAKGGEIAEYDANGKKIWSVKLAYPAAVSRY